MMNKKLFPSHLTAAALGLTSSLLLAQSPQTPAEAKPPVENQAKPHQAAPRDGDQARRQGPLRMLQVTPQSSWRIGLMAEPLPAALREHFAIPEKQGILVSRILPDSPAEKAGLKKNDIILKLSNEPVANIEKMRELVERHHRLQRPMNIEVIREGKTENVVIKPPVAAPIPKADPERQRTAEAMPQHPRMAQQQERIAKDLARQAREIEELRKQLNQLRKEIQEKK